MEDDFDPYQKWLDIPPEDRPPNHYRLLGIRIGEENPQVIADAAQWRAVIVGTFQSGPHRDHVPRLLEEIEAARDCLLDHAAHAAYDASLGLGARFHPRTLFPAWLLRDMLYVACGLLLPLLIAFLVLQLLPEGRPAPDASGAGDAQTGEHAPETPLAPFASAAGASSGPDSSRPRDKASLSSDVDETPGSGFGFERLLLDWQRTRLTGRETPEPLEVARARSVLAAHALDAEARATLGKFECFAAGEWGSGLRHLSSCNDATLVRLASLEAGQPDTAVEVLELADAWYSWGRQAVEPDRQGAYFRSLTWYRRAGPGLSAADKQRIESQISEMAAALSDAPPGLPQRSPWLDHPPGQVRVLAGHTGNVTALVASPSGAVLASAAEDRTVRMWDVRTGEQVWKQETQTHHLTGLVITPDLQAVISNFDDRHFSEMRVVDGRVRRYVGESPGPPVGLCLTREGFLLWAADSSPHSLFVWDLAQNRLGERHVGGDGIRAVDLSPDGQRIALGNSRGQARIVDRRTGASVWEVSAHAGPLTAIDFSADGGRVVTASEHEVRVWAPPAPEPVHMISVADVRTAAISPDGRRLACGGADAEILLWDVQTGQRHALPRAATASAGAPVSCLAFLPDSRGLATGDTAGEVRLWRLPD